MGFLRDLKKAFEISSDSKAMKEFNQNLLTGKNMHGQSTYTSSYNHQKRLENLERCSITTPETLATISIQIDNTMAKLSKPNLSEEEKQQLKSELLDLLKKEDKLYKHETYHSISSEKNR